jgi:hypothetical protein
VTPATTTPETIETRSSAGGTGLTPTDPESGDETAPSGEPVAASDIPFSEDGGLVPMLWERLGHTVAFQKAEDEAAYPAVRACMEGAGFEFEQTPPVAGAGRPVPAGRRDDFLGVTDATIASQWGYRIPEDLEDWWSDNQAPEHTFTLADGGSPDGSPADVALYECKSQVRERLEGGLVTIRDGVKYELWDPAQASPEVVAAVADWSACMAKSGYHYQKPSEPVWDPQWSDEYVGEKPAGGYGPDTTIIPAPPLGPDEIKAATTDVACKEKTGLTDTYRQAIWREQDKYIAANLTYIEQFKERIETIKQRAAELVAETS